MSVDVMMPSIPGHGLDQGTLSFGSRRRRSRKIFRVAMLLIGGGLVLMVALSFMGSDRTSLRPGEQKTVRVVLPPPPPPPEIKPQEKPPEPKPTPIEDRKSTRLNSNPSCAVRMPAS